jgi:hypothetical protein
MDALARDGVPVVFRCSTWSRGLVRPHHLNVVMGYVGGDDYAKFICGCRICLGFLFKGNRDLQTTRSVEIPACGGFLLAERTDEHLALFREGEEAEFFDNYDELLRKVRYYLTHEDERFRIAQNGLRRCRESGYSYDAVLESVVRQITGLCGASPR